MDGTAEERREGDLKHGKRRETGTTHIKCSYIQPLEVTVMKAVQSPLTIIVHNGTTKLVPLQHGELL